MLSSGTEAEHYPAIALRLFEEARDRPFCWMDWFGVSVVVSIKISRSAASQCWSACPLMHPWAVQISYALSRIRCFRSWSMTVVH